jgi:hypothetical protein
MYLFGDALRAQTVAVVEIGSEGLAGSLASRGFLLE